MQINGNVMKHTYDALYDVTKVELNIYGHYDVTDIVNHLKCANTQNMGIKRVIFNDPATIVFWHDGTKTVVKCQGDDVFDEETGLLMCIAKKVYGNKGAFNDVIKKWCGNNGNKQMSYVHYDKNGNRICQTDLCKYYDGSFFSVVAFADEFVVGTPINGDEGSVGDKRELSIFIPRFCEDMEYDRV